MSKPSENTGPYDREPTDDERAGMAWWNSLTLEERSRWLSVAGTAVVADAWEAFKCSQRSDAPS